ncbi:hypothetical protein [Roseibium salinum]|uniref:Tat pathway signal sequence domain protein n=1 Tax=Roseibium salinum TaxID=1604349 RepID=A0ABT3QWU8_9HYPH|nr:hypothetical protein [Roseibium sp. DSM 29163]MCX2721414.1 hypothetical protein [Roseibium sp. DSM 29163]
MTKNMWRIGILAGTALFGSGSPQAAEPEPAVNLQLNRTAASDNGCTLTFVAANRTAEALSKAAFEFVLFDKDGLVDRMTVFDFGSLPAEKTVVRQFALGGINCEALGSILVNGAAGCGGESRQEALCSAALKTESRAEIPFSK